MSTQYNYTCPTCSEECSVDESLTGQNVLCPNCSQEFYATPPTANTEIILPEKLPFFKAGRKRILKERLAELVEDGEMSKEDDDTLRRTAILLGLNQSDVDKLTKAAFAREFEPIKRRIEETWHLTDQDSRDIESLKRKYGIENLLLGGDADLFRRSYLLEVKREAPRPVSCDLMLESREAAYFCTSSTWHQIRVQNKGYVGASVSVPTGIKGVRFRFGRYNPVRSEALTPLANGTLWVTSKRLIFHGDARSTKVEHKRIIDLEVFSDALKVEKSSGRPDYFTTDPAQARYCAALIGWLKAEGAG